jgi:hypothetical protein
VTVKYDPMMRHCCQIFFLKRQKHQILITRTIHDNFLYVKNFATGFHKSKTPLLSSSLTSAKRPIPSWKFIRSLKKKGFPSHFRNWIVAPLTTATSRLLLNLVAGFPTRHGRGLRQRDTLSPLLFNLLFPLTRFTQILKSDSRHGLLHKRRGRGTILHMSLYVNGGSYQERHPKLCIHPWQFWGGDRPTHKFPQEFRSQIFDLEFSQLMSPKEKKRTWKWRGGHPVAATSRSMHGCILLPAAPTSPTPCWCHIDWQSGAQRKGHRYLAVPVVRAKQLTRANN